MNNSWLTLLTNKSPIESIFREEQPDLDDVDLHEVVIHRDGPKVTLVFDLNTFPTSPPKKWLIGKFNKVQIRLIAFSVQEFSMNHVKVKNRVSINITKEGESIRLKTNEIPLLNILAEHLILEKISAYQNSENT